MNNYYLNFISNHNEIELWAYINFIFIILIKHEVTFILCKLPENIYPSL